VGLRNLYLSPIILLNAFLHVILSLHSLALINLSLNMTYHCLLWVLQKNEGLTGGLEATEPSSKCILSGMQKAEAFTTTIYSRESMPGWQFCSWGIGKWSGKLVINPGLLDSLQSKVCKKLLSQPHCLHKSCWRFTFSGRTKKSILCWWVLNYKRDSWIPLSSPSGRLSLSDKQKYTSGCHL
jgi:hypothetical protein